MKGLTIWFSIGTFAGFTIEFETKHPFLFRIVLGWFSFVIMGIDMDYVINNLILDINKNKVKIDENYWKENK